MKIESFVEQIRTEPNQETEKRVIVDTSDRDGLLLAAFLKSTFGRDQVLCVNKTPESAKED